MPRTVQYDEATAYAIRYLTERGYACGVHFVESSAVSFAASIVFSRGFGVHKPIAQARASSGDNSLRDG